MTSIKQLQKDIEHIMRRNRQVEKNKAWETSGFRKLLLIIFTYLTIAIYLRFINVDRHWINAIVPAIGFWLSTISLPFFKSLWEKYIHKV